MAQNALVSARRRKALLATVTSSVPSSNVPKRVREKSTVSAAQATPTTKTPDPKHAKGGTKTTPKKLFHSTLSTFINSRTSLVANNVAVCGYCFAEVREEICHVG